MTVEFPLRPDLSNVRQPISAASGMPNDYYVDENIFRHERDVVLGNNWACIGFASDIANKGQVKPVDLMGLPLLMLRDSDEEVRVFHNVCSHRGMRLVPEATTIQGMIRCPYHSWTYALNGELKGTPHVGGVGVHKDDRFDCAKHGLKPVRSHVWLDMVFVNLSGGAASFDVAMAPLFERLKPFWGESGPSSLAYPVSGGRWEMTLSCNWKLAVENYCEAYHLPWIHPGLNSYSRLEDHYNIAFGEAFAGQGSLAYNLSSVAGTALPQFSEWPQDKLNHAEYISVFPNVLIGIQADHFFAMLIEPLAPEQTREHLRLYFVGDDALEDVYSPSRKSVLEAWQEVFNEDIDAVEGMQLGRHSPGFQGGVFTPELDQPTWYFHQWMAKQWEQGA